MPTLTQYTDILRVYRNQPQAESSVYRNVLQGKFESILYNVLCNFLFLEKIVDEKGEVTEVRVNLIHFYNNVFVKKIQHHATTYYSAVRSPRFCLT